mgnify:CR=1 FL=1
MNILRKSLGRQLFLWLAGTIVVTIVAVAAVIALTTFANPAGMALEHKRLEAFTSHSFERVWRDPADRDAFAAGIARDLELEVTVLDAGGTVLSRHGEVCRAPRTFIVPVNLDGAKVGEVQICKRHRRGALLNLLAILLTVGLVLWGLAWLLARRLGRPLQELADVAGRLGDGELDARATDALKEGGEIASLATSLHEMADRIDAQLRDQRALLAGVSHELRTPLQHMRLLVELGKTDELETEIVEMDDLVDQLLLSSRLDFSLRDVRTIDPVEIALESLERTGGDPELLDVRGELPPTQADPAMIRRALANLLRNATEHAGGVRELVIDATDGKLRFRVVDCGRETVAPEAFEAFQTDGGSLGLGLYLVRRVALAHGGGVHTEPGSVGFTLATG